MSIILKNRLLFSNIRGILSGEGTKAHWDKSPLGQKPTGQNPTGQKGFCPSGLLSTKSGTSSRSTSETQFNYILLVGR